MRCYILLLILMISCNSTSPVDEKKEFHRLINFEPTSDVKNINHYIESEGKDTSHWMAFDCDRATMDKIQVTLMLEENEYSKGLAGGLNADPTTWWDTASIAKAKPAVRKQNNDYWYLWYDTVKSRAYFLKFNK